MNTCMAESRSPEYGLTFQLPTICVISITARENVSLPDTFNVFFIRYNYYVLLVSPQNES